ncbi:MAG: long-chain fatty acid--CoA ligase [Actinomycetia bacterium]|nr:long-chain fatty acid--CoA ligase [Actinomycetes bacterium]
MLRGLNMDRPLLLSSALAYAGRTHGATEVVSSDSAGVTRRLTWAEIDQRARWAARALGSLGVEDGQRVATIAWNDHRHLEAYYAAFGSGACLHTVNPRLFDDQLAYIVDHADDTVICFDPDFAEMAQRLRERSPRVRHWVALGADDAGVDGALVWDDLVAASQGPYEWPEFDERQGAALCYTSGTTGNPKGILYHHRALVLQAMAVSMGDGHGINSTENALLAVPMFHVNGWAVPFTAPLTGASLILPGPDVAPTTLIDWINTEQATWSAGVPTVWLGVVQELERTGQTLESLRHVSIGGSSAPLSLVRTLQDTYGVEVSHVWGMTEMTLGSSGTMPRRIAALPRDQRDEKQMKAGRETWGVDLKIVDLDDNELPRDGEAQGELLARGPWVAGSYYTPQGREPAPDTHTDDGWLRTGDVATIDPDGWIQIVDRIKDVIKSGGEWISSIELENAAVGCAGVAEAAVIGLPHPKWQERPLLVVVRDTGSAVTADQVRAHLEGEVAKWWLPDEIVFVDDIPHTGTGKIRKTALRDQFADHQLPG